MALAECVVWLLMLLSVRSLAYGLLPWADPNPSQRPVASDFDRAIADCQRLRNEGRYTEALAAAQLLVEIAVASHNQRGEIRARTLLGNCQLLLSQYKSAAATYLLGYEVAMRAKDSLSMGKLAHNLANVYEMLGDFELADQQEARAAQLVEHLDQKQLFATILVGRGTIKGSLGDSRSSDDLYSQAISVAQTSKLPATEGLAWDFLGKSLLETNRLNEAETALNRSYQIRSSLKDTGGLAVINADLAILQYKRKNYDASLKLLDAAMASGSQLFGTIPAYMPSHLRGQILVGLNRPSEAMAEYKVAVDAADRWRQGSLPGDATNSHTVASLTDVYRDYALLAARESIKRHDSGLAQQALAVLSHNRAASLREQLLAEYQRVDRLPPRYYELISQLQGAQAHATLEQSAKDEAKTKQIRLELSELENRLGVQSQNNPVAAEKRRHQKSLRDIQARLSKSELLLSFCLGKSESYLWAVTGDRVTLYELPPEAEIGKQVAAFSQAVQQNLGDKAIHSPLSSELFGRLDSRFLKKPEWLVVADGALLKGVPLEALELPRSAEDAPSSPKPPSKPVGATRTIGQSHALRYLPSELLLFSPDVAQPERRFVGIGDPIYNAADARRSRISTVTPSGQAVVTLGRLVGSDREVRTAAGLSGLPQTSLLIGSDATGPNVATLLAKPPSVIHFAVHVVSPDGRPEEAALALSMTKDGLPELLTAETISGYRVPGSIVVLSGCSSEQGKAIPSVGLVGLSRAWLLAGAAAVIVSAWPTADDSGHFFASFYQHFQVNARGPGPVAKWASSALQMAQLDMQQGGGYRSLPSFWAAYSIISKE